MAGAPLLCLAVPCSPGVQAAYAAYSAIATQAATVVGAMDKVWAGGSGVEGEIGSQSGSADAEQQQARLAVALQSSEDGDDVYVQVRGLLGSINQVEQ